MKSNILVCTILALAVSSAIAATVIHVPADQPTIQAGINAAANGDTVLVSPGTYKENINFNGKAITVKSSGGAKVTIIDGGRVTSVVTFSSNETFSSVLSGFTIQNGVAIDSLQAGGGGIAVEVASPTIKGNIIQNNTGSNAGGGILRRTCSNHANSAAADSASHDNCPASLDGGALSMALCDPNTVAECARPFFKGLDSYISRVHMQIISK